MAPRIGLRPYEDALFGDYLELQRETSVFRHMADDPAWQGSLREMMRELDEPTFMAYRVADGAFVGQCGVNSRRGGVWELGIELLGRYRGQGYGSEMLPLLVKTLRERYGQERFCAIVDADNDASMALMRGVGGMPAGVRRSVVLGRDEDAERFEDEHRELVRPGFAALAEEFGCEPRQLLSHALVFDLSSAGP